ncbi:tRNA preQ1(34) S-adenosylmethionine ribosyltransferase-isomerase QueA [Halalkalibaculum sp. DA3122]|uniref:tRNA preQ1(34) S-adenosylmethionine ribosyltransferase-isomerase QueA n=1 Tax=Halalkalibaculum sp. DA3122 TaxID=3373607 RepID=UPI003754A92B
MSFSLSDFDYELPKELIAQEPVHPRDHARLLVYDRSRKTITDDHFYNILDYLPENTTLVANNSKVEKCRLLFEDGRREIFILETINPTTVRALVRPGKKFGEGKTVELTGQITATVLSVDEEGIRTLQLTPSLHDPIYNTYKYTPFPPYIEQDESLSGEYQTVYARDPGSKAAPTAGLHFTDSLIDKIETSTIDWAEVTLHVGLGTFAPVKTEDIDEHNMHSEWYEIDRETADKLNSASHITAIGTTSMRVLESNADRAGQFKPETRETDIFIRPGYQFKAADALITNFHLPKSTLLMLIAAFMGFEEMHRVYRHAIENEYRFYSFGDAMLIL